MTRERGLFALIIFSFVGLLYYPAISETFLFRDDYLQLYRYVTGHYRFPANALVEGRPLYWLGVHAIYPFLHNSADFAWVRLLNLVLIGWFGVALHRLLMHYGWDRKIALSLTLLTLTLPCFCVIAGWAATFQIILGAIAGLYAGHYAVSERPRLAAILLLAAFCLYQSSAMMFWYVILFACLRPDGLVTGWDRLFTSAIWRFFPVMAVYFVGYKLALHVFADAVRFDHQMVRTVLETNPADKLMWFLTGPLMDSLQLSYVPGSPLFAGCVLLLIVSGGWQYVKKPVMPLLAFVMFCLIMAYLPVLAVAERNDEFRLQIVLAPMVAYLVGLAVYRLSGRYAKTLLVLMAVMYGAEAAKYFRDDFIKPQVAHREHILSQLRPLQKAAPDTIYYDASDPKPPARHEYGSVESEANGTLHVLYWELSGTYTLFKSKEIADKLPDKSTPVIHLY